MNSRKDFAQDLESLSAAVETDVSRVVTLLRNDQPATARGSQLVTTKPTSRQTPTEESDAVSHPPAEPPSTQRRTTAEKPRNKAAVGNEVILENVTTRLQRETNEQLTEAALRQKLKKLTPATRQDIFNEAVRDWLRKHGYAH